MNSEEQQIDFGEAIDELSLKLNQLKYAFEQKYHCIIRAQTRLEWEDDTIRGKLIIGNQIKLTVITSKQL